MIVIPKPDHRLRKIVFIPDRAQARCAQQKIPARVSWISPKPPVGENANEMSAGKEQHISTKGPDTLNHTVCPLANLQVLPLGVCQNMAAFGPALLT